jgi:hypothetical protein
MAEGDQVSGTGDQGQGGAQGSQESLGWRAGLPGEFRENDWAKAHGKVGDFFKDAIAVKTERDTLKTQLGKAIFKPGENAKPEEIASYRKAMGIPEKPTEYEWATTEGLENDPKMMEWAGGVFHKAGLSKDQAKLVSGEWNQFIQGMLVAEENSTKEAKAKAEAEFKKELGSDEKYKEAVAVIGRVWKKLSNSEFDAFLDDTGIGNDARLLKFVYEVAKKTGEDLSLKGQPSRQTGPSPGIIYDKSPAPPQN